MNKKEYCLNHDTVGVIIFSMCNEIAVKGIEYGIDDYVIYQHQHGNNVTFHKSKINYTSSGYAYFNFSGHRIHLDEIMWFKGVSV